MKLKDWWIMSSAMDVDVPTIGASSEACASSASLPRNISTEDASQQHDWQALRVVDSLEELQACLLENRHANLLALPRSTLPTNDDPPRRIVGDLHPQHGAPPRRSSRIRPHPDRSIPMPPLRPFVTPATYCSHVADALAENTALKSLTLEEVPLVNPTHNHHYPPPQPQLFWLGQSVALHPSLKRVEDHHPAFTSRLRTEE